MRRDDQGDGGGDGVKDDGGGRDDNGDGCTEVMVVTMVTTEVVMWMEAVAEMVEAMGMVIVDVVLRMVEVMKGAWR